MIDFKEVRKIIYMNTPVRHKLSCMIYGTFSCYGCGDQEHAKYVADLDIPPKRDRLFGRPIRL